MCSGLDVVAHPTGPWLVRVGPVVYAVPADLGRPLLAWRGRRAAADLAAAPAPAGVDPDRWRDFVAVLAGAAARPGCE
ncbi:hypothetical protein KDM41_06720, partial [bacterium]|nr:hypothetical protein [bacterium]